MNTVIIAPHPDDELIGCFEVLNKAENIIIIYHPSAPQNRRDEALKLKEEFSNIKMQMFQYNIPMNMVNQDHEFYFPDPSYEIHPLHRQLGMTGEMYARNGIKVTFYNTIMNAPYIHEVGTGMKEEQLDKIYPSQKDMWKYEKKYVLFEGYCKWIF